MIQNIYIHIPFCNNICSYCDFCKIKKNDLWTNKYLDALEKEINDNYKNEIIKTIYIGGGTPSSLSIIELKKLFNIVNKINLSNNYEFTIECNIEDITKEKLELFKENKVNRLSIGVESFNNKILKYLGRTYNSDTAKEKIFLAKQYFDNINIDLIYAVKNETLNDLKKDIDEYLKLDIPHISCYSLIIENNTILKNNNEKYISEDLDRKMYDLINKKLKEKYNHYEISNYSKKGYESKHNLCYWNNNYYYGFGLGASGYINDIRYSNTRNLTKYINDNNEKEIEKISDKDKIKYELILGFRKINGINKKDFYKKYNLNIIDLFNIKELISKNLIIDDNENIYINDKYLYVSNEILVNFI
jgi:oxygen-independent coproporphyrinogen-3 oxidase